MARIRRNFYRRSSKKKALPRSFRATCADCGKEVILGSLPPETILFASIVITRREPNRPYYVYHRGIIANLCYILMACSD
jgi:ribosomal protein L34E